MQITKTVSAPLTAILVAVAVAACSDEGTAPSTGLSASQVQDVAEVIVTEADATLDAAPLDPATGVALAPTAGGPAHSGPPPCTPDVSPNPLSNSDGDAVPDSARFDFAGCTFTRGPYSFVVSGVIDILDPTSVSTDFGIRSVFIGFTWERTITVTSRTTTVEFNGARQVTGNADALQHLITNFQTEITLPRGGTVSHVKDWNSSFTADTPGSIAHGQPLPSGILNIAGSSQWSRGENEVFSITITTSGLHFNASCTVAPRFDAGSTTAVVTRNGETTNVLVQHTACGQYTVTRSQG